MTRRFSHMTALFAQCLLSSVSYAQTPELNQRIQTGIVLIKLGCGTGVESQHTTVSGNISGSLTLTKPPGIDAGGKVEYTKDEAQGLVIALRKELTDTTLSVKQLECMKPYTDAIFKELFPDKPTGRTESRKGPNVNFGCGDRNSSEVSYSAPQGFHIVGANADIVDAVGSKSSSATVTSRDAAEARAVANFQGRDREWTGNCPGGGHGAVRITVDIDPN
jgi:hypothetical protein